MGVQWYVAMLLASACAWILVMIGQAGWNEHKRRKRLKKRNQKRSK